MKIKAASISMQGIANPREIIYFVFAPRVTASEVREGKNRGEVPVTRSRHCGDVGINSSVNVMAMTTDGRHLITGSDADCSVWDAVTKKNITVLRGHTKWVCGLAAHPSEPYAVTASYDRSVRVWDLRNGRNVLTLFGYESELYTASIASDGKRLVMTDVAGVVHVVDIDA